MIALRRIKWISRITTIIFRRVAISARERISTEMHQGLNSQSVRPVDARFAFVGNADLAEVCPTIGSRLAV